MMPDLIRLWRGHKVAFAVVLILLLSTAAFVAAAIDGHRAAPIFLAVWVFWVILTYAVLGHIYKSWEDEDGGR